MDGRPIGVFDSSVGGISVLREMISLLPGERFIYYGDTRNAPYGVRPENEILDLSLRAAEKLMDRDVKALVIACNTATSAAADTLRSRLSIPVIGIEPALKPADENHQSGLILVLATPATLRQAKFARLLGRYGRHAVPVACGGLMEFVERGELASDALRQYLTGKLTGYDAEVESVVLGCTHYVFLRRAIRDILPNARLYDGNKGSALRLFDLLRERGALSETRLGGEVTLLTSGDDSVMQPMMRMLMRIPMDD